MRDLAREAGDRPADAYTTADEKCASMLGRRTPSPSAMDFTEDFFDIDIEDAAGWQKTSDNQ